MSQAELSTRGCIPIVVCRIGKKYGPVPGQNFFVVYVGNDVTSVFRYGVSNPCILPIRMPESVLESGAQEKKRMYKHAVEDRRDTFAPFMTSVDGLLHQEAEHFLERMATCVAGKWKKTYAQTCGYIRARLLFAIIRAVSLCIRGSRVKWRSGLGFEDGAPTRSCIEAVWTMLCINI